MLNRIYRDFCTLYAIAFAGHPRQQHSSTFESHAERLEHFYKLQVADYDRFRENMLWGRLPLLQSLVAHMSLSSKHDEDKIVWIDFGGGTGSNIEKMSTIIPLSVFKSIHIVDLCPSMCKEARKRVARMGWMNVFVECADATTYVIPTNDTCADLITFSYSLSMIPDFHAAVDRAYELLSDDGMIGVADFGVDASSSWMHKMFWLSWFDIDGIKLGSERKQYLTHRFQSYYEYKTSGWLPYTYMKAPYYIWIGHRRQSAKANTVMIRRSKAPAFFPPTFLYHQSWEDPDVDHCIMNITPSDVCLTLTSGGCNTLHLLLKGAKQVVSVDVNPAQTALLELKSVAIKYLEYDDFWKMFGEGKHPYFDDIFDRTLAPFMSESSRSFWEKKRHYFQDGLYYHGSMGKICKFIHYVATFMGVKHIIDNIVHSETLAEQLFHYKVLIDRIPQSFQNTLIHKVLGYVALNRVVTWFAGGVPSAQLDLITRDDNNVMTYFKRCINNMLHNSHIRADNYFYYNILTGKYTHANCPAYLKYDNFMALKNGLINNLYISNDLFINELRQRTYDKVILMDHADWQNEKQTRELASTLMKQVNDKGLIIFRSAGVAPMYADHLRECGFKVSCVDTIENAKGYMDRVNMYASFYMCEK